MSIVQKLTEGIVNRDLSTEGAALIAKWENTGLLEGIGDDAARNGMARLLENQAKELLRESSSMAAGDVEGFAAVAFPLVRRVFGGLIANDLVSVQPMSLPSGLIFFLDFVYSPDVGDRSSTNGRLGAEPNKSIYGGGIVGSQITGGINLASGSNPEVGPYALNNGYASPTGSATLAGTSWTIVASGTAGDYYATGGFGASKHVTLGSLCDFDVDLSGSPVLVAEVALSSFNFEGEELNKDDFVAVQVSGSGGSGGVGGFNFLAGSGSANNGSAGGHIRLVRRLTQYSSASQGGPIGDRASSNVLLVFEGTSTLTQAMIAKSLTGSQAAANTWSWPETDDFDNGGALGSVIGGAEWGLENSPNIPEIDIKVDSVAVTAVTKKLKAKWTPELGQDLNAYHNLDAEVELTQILSEQIALEIDREILEDLVRGSTAGIRHWSRAAGRFVNRETGVEMGASTTPDFTGNVSEWYETLVETINDVSAQIHRKTLRGAANFVVCGPEVANILEFTAGFRANVTADSDRGDIGTVKVGSLSKKFDIYVDPYFPRTLVLVGRRGGSFLESGYVYAPYVPLQTTPTIFGVEDFVPRKGVMTRYAKKMVRPDMYGLVIVQDLV